MHFTLLTMLLFVKPGIKEGKLVYKIFIVDVVSMNLSGTWHF